MNLPKNAYIIYLFLQFLINCLIPHPGPLRNAFYTTMRPYDTVPARDRETALRKSRITGSTNGTNYSPHRTFIDLAGFFETLTAFHETSIEAPSRTLFTDLIIGLLCILSLLLCSQGISPHWMIGKITRGCKAESGETGKSRPALRRNDGTLYLRQKRPGGIRQEAVKCRASPAIATS